MRTWKFYLAKKYLVWLVGAWLGLVCVYLIGDFGDRMKSMLSHRLDDVLCLYGLKALGIVHLVAPAASLLAGLGLAAQMHRSRELTALVSLGVSPRQVRILLLSLQAALVPVLIVFDNEAVTRASLEMDLLLAQKFQTAANLRALSSNQTWFRLGNMVFQLRGATVGEWSRDVSVYRVDGDFSLKERWDVEALRPGGEGAWQAHGVVYRRFEGEAVAEWTSSKEGTLSFPGVSAEAFRIRRGRPEQMTFSELLIQRPLRAAAALPTIPLDWVWHHRWGYPVLGWLMVWLALGWSWLPGRRIGMTHSLGLGTVGCLLLFTLIIASKQLALSGRWPVPVAAWLPIALLSAVALWLEFSPRKLRGF